MIEHNLKKLNELHPDLRSLTILAWSECELAMPDNVKLWIDQALRTFDQSNELYAKGRTVPGDIVTNAKAGQSYHNYGLAFDFHMITNGKDDWSVGPLWRKVADIMKSHGFAWGGDFKSILDQPHFEYTFGYNWRALLEKYNNRDLISGTLYVKL